MAVENEKLRLPQHPEGVAVVGVEHSAVTGAESDLIWDLGA